MTESTLSTEIKTIVLDEEDEIKPSPPPTTVSDARQLFKIFCNLDAQDNEVHADGSNVFVSGSQSDTYDFTEKLAETTLFCSSEASAEILELKTIFLAVGRLFPDSFGYTCSASVRNVNIKIPVTTSNLEAFREALIHDSSIQMLWCGNFPTLREHQEILLDAFTRNRSLKSLEIGGRCPTQYVIHSLVGFLHGNTTLKDLKISSAIINLKGLDLSPITKNVVDSLVFNNCDYADHEMCEFAKNLRGNTSIKRIEFRNHDDPDKYFRILDMSIGIFMNEIPNLTTLEIYDEVLMSKEGFERFIKGLRTNERLRHLHLNFWKIDADVINEIGKALDRNNTLETLMFGCKDFSTFEGLFARHLMSNHSITKLKFGNKMYGPDGSFVEYGPSVVEQPSKSILAIIKRNNRWKSEPNRKRGVFKDEGEEEFDTKYARIS
jgi:hypothetical protein